MKKIITSAGLAALAVAALAPVSAYAEDSSLAFNVGVVSDYRYRGISQTRLKPAVQAGVDYSYGAFYVGAWASTIKWIKDNADSTGASVKGAVELDIYGGYKGAISEALAFDVGFLRYEYLGNKLANTGTGQSYKNANTTEVYGALTYGPVTGKISYALSDLFGNYNFTDSKGSDGSYYAELNASFDVGGGFMLAPHLGYQKVEHIDAASYMDYSLSVSKELVPGLTLSLAGVGTNASKNFYVPGAAYDSATRGTKDLGKKAIVLGLKYAF